MDLARSDTVLPLDFLHSSNVPLNLPSEDYTLNKYRLQLGWDQKRPLLKCKMKFQVHHDVVVNRSINDRHRQRVENGLRCNEGCFMQL